MKRRSHLTTNFLKFIVEKYKKEAQELPVDETEIPKKGMSDEFDEILDDKEVPKIKLKSVEDEEPEDDEDLDTLLKEYLNLEKKYKAKRNDNLFKRK